MPDGAAEACLTHNQEGGGSKPLLASLVIKAPTGGAVFLLLLLLWCVRVVGSGGGGGRGGEVVRRARLVDVVAAAVLSRESVPHKWWCCRQLNDCVAVGLLLLAWVVSLSSHAHCKKIIVIVEHFERMRVWNMVRSHTFRMNRAGWRSGSVLDS